MRVILEYGGWRKTAEVPYNCLGRGYYETSEVTPPTLITHEGRLPRGNGGSFTVIRFILAPQQKAPLNRREPMPLFRAEV